MNRFFFMPLFFFVAMATSVFAGDDITIKVNQAAQYSGGVYDNPLHTLLIPFGEKINLMYDFSVYAKDDEQSAIDCIMKFPKYLNIEFMSSQGIQAIEVEDDGDVPALTMYDDDEGFRICEFLMPQKKNGTAFVEFQVNVDERFAGENFPVNIRFTHLRPPFFARHGKKIGFVAGVAAGIVVGVVTFNPATGAAAGAAAGTATTAATATGLSLVGAAAAGVGTAAAITAGSAFVSYEFMKKTLQEMKNKYSSTQLNDSYTKYLIQIKEN